jgi:hypothetical protein
MRFVKAAFVTSAVLLFACVWLLYDPGHYHVVCKPEHFGTEQEDWNCVTTAVRNYERLAVAIVIAVVGVGMGVLIARRRPPQAPLASSDWFDRRTQ